MPRPSARKPRKTLRQALRDLLRRRKNVSELGDFDEQTFGSGILRKASSTIPKLPNFSTASVFTDFGYLDHSDGAQHSIVKGCSIPPHFTNPGHDRDPTYSSRLLPQPSLSSFDLRPPHGDSSIPHKVVYDLVPEHYQRGASRQASIVSEAAFSGIDSRGRPSRSSLRICDSRSSLWPTAPSRTESRPRSYMISNTLRRQTSAIENLPLIHIDSVPSTPRSSLSPTASGRNRSPLETIEHFKCFCILDTSQVGCPVTGTSKDLRYVFEVGEQFVLNNRECEGSSMDIVAGVDAAGEEIVHLVLFSPLVIPSSGQSRYMLVSLIDVTEFIRESANRLPELDAISEEASITDEINTPPPTVRHEPPLWAGSSYLLSADDLLGGCSLARDKERFSLGHQEADEDVWLALAKSEGSFKPNRSRDHTLCTPTRTSTSTRTATPSHATDATDDILEEFMKNLQRLYSDFFLLGQSPLASGAYEMCNVSPSVYASQEWIDGHLSQTSLEVITQLCEQLGQSEPFTLKVRWGIHGQPKQMYCSPLYAGSSITWICYLVDERMAVLW